MSADRLTVVREALHRDAQCDHTPECLGCRALTTLEVLEAELRDTRKALEQIAYGLWGDQLAAEIVKEHARIALRALTVAPARSEADANG